MQFIAANDRSADCRVMNLSIVGRKAPVNGDVEVKRHKAQRAVHEREHCPCSRQREALACQCGLWLNHMPVHLTADAGQQGFAVYGAYGLSGMKRQAKSRLAVINSSEPLFSGTGSGDEVLVALWISRGDATTAKQPGSPAQR